MKPFLLLQARPEQEAADNEYEAFLRFGKLKPGQLVRVALDKGELRHINLDEYSGVLQGGRAANVSDPPEKKTAAEREYEPRVFELLGELVARDFPYLGACAGVGLLTAALGGTMSNKYAEAVGPVDIELMPAAGHDPLLSGLPRSFKAFVGHKEACEVLPDGVRLLASSVTCPVQMMKVGQNVYATQFHPELDNAGLELRINVYKHAGYFDPSQTEKMVEIARSARVTEPVKILEQFIERYARTTASTASD